MIAQVIPAKRGIARLAWFDYLVPDELLDRVAIGQLVVVPFRSGEIFGVIKSLTAIGASATFRLKMLSKIINDIPILSQEQLAFLEEMSAIYQTSLGFLVKSNLLPLQKRKIQKWPDRITQGKKIAEQKISKPVLFTYQTETAKSDYLASNIQSGQTLILVPEVNDIDNLLASLPEAVRNRSVAVRGETSPKDFFILWQQLWSGEKNIAIGTRRALFLPFFNLQTIILDDEGNDNHKSFDSTPRFHARDAAVILAKHHSATLHLMSFAPSVESYYFAKAKVYRSDGEILPTAGQNYILLDIKNDRRGGIYSAITLDLAERLKECAHGTIFLFCHRRGTLGYVTCRDCKNVAKCPRCAEPLAFHGATNTLECHHCQHNEPMRAICSNCQGTNIAMFGAGTDLVMTELKTILPKDKRKLICIDSDSEKLPPPTNNDDKIIVGTQMAWPNIAWEKVALMAFIDIDTPLFVPEYKTTERVWQTINHARYLLPSAAQMYVQTIHPEHPIFTGLAKPELFYDSELKQRRQFKYPPYQYILRLYTSGQNEVILKKEMNAVRGEMVRLTKTESTVTIMPDSPMFPSFSQGEYFRAIIVKIPYARFKKIIRTILTVVPENWKVDPNPTTLL